MQVFRFRISPPLNLQDLTNVRDNHLRACDVLLRRLYITSDRGDGVVVAAVESGEVRVRECCMQHRERLDPVSLFSDEDFGDGGVLRCVEDALVRCLVRHDYASGVREGVGVAFSGVDLCSRV